MKKLTFAIGLFFIPGIFSVCKAEEISKPTLAKIKVHHCESEAFVKADKLLRLHFSDDSNAKDIESLSIDDKVTLKAPIKNPKGKGKYDVLEVVGRIYKGEYRMRFIYAQINDTCVLMGQEILEYANI